MSTIPKFNKLPDYAQQALRLMALNMQQRTPETLRSVMERYPSFTETDYRDALYIAMERYAAEFKRTSWVQAKDAMDALSVTAALWWFLENSNEDTYWRSDAWFYLRERVRNAKPTPTDEVVGEIADFLAALVECFSKIGEYNNFTAPMGFVEVREKAADLAKKLGVPFPGEESDE